MEKGEHLLTHLLVQRARNSLLQTVDEFSQHMHM
jgi:hypothetical protein